MHRCGVRGTVSASSAFINCPVTWQAESQIRLRPRDSIVLKSTVSHYDSKTEEAVRRMDEYRALPARFTSARRDCIYTGQHATKYERNQLDKKQDRLTRAFLL